MLPSIKSLRSLVILIVSAFASWLSFPVFCLTTAIFVVLVSLLSVVPGTGEQAQHSIPQTGALLFENFKYLHEWKEAECLHLVNRLVIVAAVC